MSAREQTLTPIGMFRAFERFGLKRVTIAALLGLQLGATIFEGIGIGMLLPVFQLLQAEGDVATLAQSSRMWEHLISGYGRLGIPVTVGVLMLTVFASILIRQAFTYASQVYRARVNLNLQRRVRDRCFSRLLSVRIGYLEREPLGAIVNDFTVELERALGCVGAFLKLVGLAIMLAVYFGLMLAISVPMTAIAAALMAGAVFSLRGLVTRSKRTGERCLEVNRKISTFLVERLRAVRLIRLSGMEVPEIETMEGLNANQRTQYLIHEELAARLATTIEPLVVGVLLVFLYVGVVEFELAVEEFGLFLLIVLRLLPVVKEVASTRQSAMATVPSLKAIEGRLEDMEEASEDAGGGRRLERLGESVRLENISFRYAHAGAVPALDDVSVEFRAGRITALVGPSGSGKSTLIDLLPRLRVPNSGRVLWDGAPAEIFDLASLRQAIAYAPQSPQIFNATAAEHIGYGRAGADAAADAAAVRDAARLAGAHEFIEELPQGYDTLLGEDGVTLSGGQRQRLDLARALVRRAPVLILDEPTSNLDAESEDIFRRSLERVRDETGIAIIIVGHRLSTVAIADPIVVLEQGRVTASGSHEELLAAGGWYARAYATQMGGAADTERRAAPPAMRTA